MLFAKSDVVGLNRSGFRSMSWDVRPGSAGDAVFYLRKDGEGHAVVAQLRASDECGQPSSTGRR